MTSQTTIARGPAPDGPHGAAAHEALTACFWLGLFFTIATVISQIVVLEPHPGVWRDGSTLVVGRDFMNFWMYGKSASLERPGIWYDVPSYHGVQRAWLGEDYQGSSWSYPPSVIPFAWPFAQLPYLASLALWSALGLGVLAATLRNHGHGVRFIAMVFLGPAAVFCLISGQSSLLTAAMTLGALAALDRRPVLAGVLIGLLTLKPQLGLLYPLMLAASGRWRVFGVAAATTLVIVALTTVLYGPQVWIDFVTMGLPVQSHVMADPELIATPFYVTVFMNVRGLDAPYWVAMSAQMVVSLAAAAIVWRAFSKHRDADPQMLGALFLACSVAVTPYMLAYDSLPLAIAAMALLASGKLDGVGRRLALAVFWLPLIQMVFGSVHIPGPALIAPAFAVWLALKLEILPRWNFKSAAASS
jgi:hypothetical protein